MIELMTWVKLLVEGISGSRRCVKWIERVQISKCFTGFNTNRGITVTIGDSSLMEAYVLLSYTNSSGAMMLTLMYYGENIDAEKH
jgi:hypothetical protein